MNLLKPTVLSLALAASAGAQAETADKPVDGQTIAVSGSQASVKGPSDFFTGDARIDPLFPANETAHYSGAYVTFEPGARSAWHLHPAGQHIIVTSGVGRTGTADGHIEEIKAGDVIWCPPGVEHWHGAAPDTAMTHLVVTGTLDGSAVEWKDKVTDDEYHGK